MSRAVHKPRKGDVQMFQAKLAFWGMGTVEGQVAVTHCEL